MSTVHPSAFLRYALLGDALASGATGVLAFAADDALANLLGLPQPLLRYAGLVLLPYAIFVGWLGRRASVPRGAVWAVVVMNALWAADSMVLLASGWVARRCSAPPSSSSRPLSSPASRRPKPTGSARMPPRGLSRREQ